MATNKRPANEGNIYLASYNFISWYGNTANLLEIHSSKPLLLNYDKFNILARPNYISKPEPLNQTNLASRKYLLPKTTYSLSTHSHGHRGGLHLQAERLTVRRPHRRHHREGGPILGQGQRGPQRC